MILSDKVAGIIKDLQVEVGVKEVALNSAMRRINKLKNQVEELLIENEELRERIRDYGNR
jgi:hypothetical protein